MQFQRLQPAFVPVLHSLQQLLSTCLLQSVASQVEGYQRRSALSDHSSQSESAPVANEIVPQIKALKLQPRATWTCECFGKSFSASVPYTIDSNLQRAQWARDNGDCHILCDRTRRWGTKGSAQCSRAVGAQVVAAEAELLQRAVRQCRRQAGDSLRSYAIACEAQAPQRSATPQCWRQQLDAQILEIVALQVQRHEFGSATPQGFGKPASTNTVDAIPAQVEESDTITPRTFQHCLRYQSRALTVQAIVGQRDRSKTGARGCECTSKSRDVFRS
mmetsp:Transcript_32231/g.85865  ORF Transcript_32231/g.85865 Transcript_32231/m.85865 type:complete len:275 (-) Transcript_32231:97-921(-)